MSLLSTLTHAPLAAGLTLACFLALPLTFSQSDAVLSESVGLADESEPPVVQLTLSPDELAALSRAEGAPTEADPTESAGSDQPMLSSSAGAWLIPHGTRPPARERGTLSPKPSSSRGQCTPRPVEGIRAVGPRRWEVERSLVKSYTRDLDRLDALAAARRHSDGEGGADGYRLVRVDCDSPLRAAGLQRGDVVRAVNGQPLTSTAEVLSAYARTRKACRFVVEITRRGQPMTLRYQVV